MELAENKLKHLINKKFLVTGATSGIGFAVCEQLLIQKNSVVALGRDKSKIEKLLKLYPSSLQFIPVDLSVIVDFESFMNIALNERKFDGFVHCAGMEETLPLPLYNPNNVKKIFEINVFAGIEILRYFAKKKYSNDGASVIYLSSVMGELGQPGKIGYCATKSAILGVVKASALELAKRKIRVNAISPGVVNTPMTQNLFSQLDQENINKIVNMHPLGIGNLEDVVPLLLFLLSDQAKWITGQNIKIDGGYSIQ